MAIGIWVRRSLRYYGARHLAFAGAAALTAAILCAALLTGESLQAGLRRGLCERLGGTRSAVYLTEGVFPASLAERISGTRAALLLRGELLNADGAVCADRAQIVGVIGTKASSRAALNGRGVEILSGPEGAVRFEKPALFPVEMPLGTVKENRLVRRAVRFEASRLAGTSALPLTPDFALRAASVPPVNVFLPYASLAEAAGVPGMANLLVSEAEPATFEKALAAALTPEDAGLTLEDGRQRTEDGERRTGDGERRTEDGGQRTEDGGQRTAAGGRETEDGGAASPSILVKSRRVFLTAAVLKAMDNAGLKTAPAMFHLADAFEAGTNATPYGFVAAVTPDGVDVPQDLQDDEIVVNAWLAETLGVSTNQTLTLSWRRFEAGGRLVADRHTFRVRAVLPTERAAAAKGAMPIFPGLAGVDSCAAWDVGLPMDEEKLKDAANEAYWKQWRETPKAFITYAAGVRGFGTFFGAAMSVRVAADEAQVRQALKTLPPALSGFSVRPVWEEGVAAARGTTDFRLLFVGMAFVLMASALLLSSLSLSLALEMRKSEVALFMALGWSRRQVVRTLAAEWCVPLVAGAVAGGGCGTLLARALVWSLGRFWNDAFAGAQMSFHFSWPLACVAAGVSAVLALGVLLRTVNRFAHVQPVELWQGEGTPEVLAPGRSQVGGIGANTVGGALAVAALAVMVWSPGGAAANGTFFGAGFLLMISLLLFVKSAGTAWATIGTADLQGVTRAVRSPVAAGVRRALGAPRRSAPVVILLAVGTFLTVGILSMKHDPAAGCEKPSSGSGGFASLVSSVVPRDRERGLELARRVSGSRGVVPARVRPGDEAGCLNMSQPVRPQIVGLDARAMARARAFEPVDAGGVWTPLENRLADGCVPALAADQTMLQYSLKAKAGAADGTVFEYPGRDGTVVRVRIVGALPVRSGILQGSLIVDEKQFVAMFPDEGYRLWLCDYAPYLLREAAEVRGQKSESKGRRSEAVAQARHPEPGVTVTTAQERLRLLGSVESAYLDIFLVLGGLGVVLGVAGIALVILRGVAERRGELALLAAVGLPRRAVRRLLAAEYGALTLAGLGVGVVPALVAIQPAARSLGGALPWQAMTGVVAGLFGCAALCVALAAQAAAHGSGPEVLKEEV